MLYNAEKRIDVERAIAKVNDLIKRKKKFEVIEKKPIRSLSQNNYLHLILSWFALEYGETLEYIKIEYFKKLVNKELFEFKFENHKTGEVRTEYRSTATLDTRELTLAIDKFRDFAAKHANIYLPEPSDLMHLQEIQDEITQNKNLLYL